MSTSTERVKKWRKNNPIMAAYQAHKSNAKRRGIPSELTFEQFKEFALEIQYMVKKGIYKNSLHIDRIDESKGYTVDNIQALENTKNIKKSLEFRGRDQYGNLHMKVKTHKPTEQGNCPF
jgi:hypothetical protein